MRFPVSDSLVAAVQSAQSVAYTNNTRVYVIKDGDQFSMSYDKSEAQAAHIRVDPDGSAWHIVNDHTIEYNPERPPTLGMGQQFNVSRTTFVKAIVLNQGHDSRWSGVITFKNEASMTTVGEQSLYDCLDRVRDELIAAGYQPQ